MGCRIAALKLLIIVPNIIFFILGCAMVGWTAFNLDRFRESFENDRSRRREEDNVKTVIYAISGVSIAAGVILCIVSFLAFCGALAEKRRMLISYAIILCVVILLEITAAILAFVIPHEIVRLLNNEDTEDELKENLLALKENTYLFGLGLMVMVCVEIILALSACFLASKMKEDQVWEFPLLV